MKKRTVQGRVVWQCVMVAVILLTTGFIWSNSMRNATASGAQSGFFKQLFAQIFDITREPFRFLYDHLRKLAHFAEFALLGTEVSLLLLASAKKRLPVRLLLGMCFCVLVAVVDETIQLFVPGRVACAVDVCIDSAGALCGVLLCFGAALLRPLFKKK